MEKTPSQAAIPGGSSRVHLSPHGLPGILATFCGVDGSGKTTTLHLARELLREQSIEGVEIKMPSSECRRLDYFRRYAEDHTSALGGTIDLPALCLVLLGDRLLTVRTRILPLLAEGRCVLCDRYLYTALAELLAVGASREDMGVLLQVAEMFPRPDLAIVADVSADEAIRRIHERPDERDARIDRPLFDRFIKGFRHVSHDNGLLLVSTEHGRGAVAEVLAPHLQALIEQRPLLAQESRFRPRGAHP